MVLGAWCLVLGSLLGALCVVLGAWWERGIAIAE
jgi:hypothetical protein